MNSRRWNSLRTMLALAVPLIFALHWLAREFPKWHESSTVTWVGDRYVRWSRSSADPGTQIMLDEGDVLLDVQSGRVQRFRPPEKAAFSGFNSYYTSRNEVTADGRVVWSKPEFAQGMGAMTLRVTDPESLATESHFIDLNDILVGGRYLINRQPVGDDYHVLDLQEPQPLRRNFPAFTPHFQTASIPDHPNFFCIHYAKAQNGAATVNYDRAPWLRELERIDASQSPQLAKTADLAMLVLCRMTNQGPEEIAHWPTYVHIRYGAIRLPNIRADGPYIFCPSLDNRCLNVHDANTGQIIAKIDFAQTGDPNNETSAQENTSWPEWQANRIAVLIEGASTAFDPATGKPLPFKLGNKKILDRRGDHYLTLNRPLNSPASSPPLSLQIWKTTTGELLATHLHPAPPSLGHMQTLDELYGAMRLSTDGQQILIGTQNERVLFLDALSGKVIRSVAVSPWRYPGIAIVLMLTAAWMVGWYRACLAAQMPRLIYAVGISAIVLAFLAMRCTIDGQYVNAGRLASQCVWAILLAWNVELVQYLIRPGTSVALRLAFLATFGLALSLAKAYIFYEFSDEVFFVFWTTVNISLAMVFLVLRARGKLLPLPGAKVSHRKFGIKHILLLTTIIAILASTSASSNWIYLFEMPDFFYFVAASISIGLAAVLFRAWFVLRVIGVVVSVFVAVYVTQRNSPSETLWWACSLIGPLAAASFVHSTGPGPAQWKGNCIAYSRIAPHEAISSR